MSKKAVMLISTLAVMFFSCREKIEEGFIMTVNGPVHLSSVGQTLSHEHIMVDWIGADSTGYHRWHRDSVIIKVLPWLKEITDLGVECLVDCSPAYLGRDPFLLRGLSEKTGLHIITNTGYYGAANNRFMPEHAWEDSAHEIAARWIDEYNNGIDDSGVKPGFIKIGVASGSLSELHSKLVRAAAITHIHTGLTIKSHTGEDIPAFEQIKILSDEGVSPDAFIWTHAQRGSIEKLVEAASSGAWISLDGVNVSSSGPAGEHGNIDWYAGRLTELKGKGVLSQVLISHDAGWYTAGEPGGGSFRGYGDIHRYLIPALRDRGFTADEISSLLTVNPARALEVRVRPAH